MKTMNYRLADNAGINKTLSNTFGALTGMWALTAVASYFSLGLHLTLGTLLGLFVASFVALFATMAFRDSGAGLVCLGIFSVLEGMSLGPVLNHYLALRNGAEIVMVSAMLTTAAVFGCTMYATTTRKDFSHLHGFLVGATLVLILASLVSLFFPVPMFSLLIAVATACIFLVWMLVDVSDVVNGKETNYISAALGIYLDMLNVFLALLRILGAASSDD